VPPLDLPDVSPEAGNVAGNRYPPFLAEDLHADADECEAARVPDLRRAPTSTVILRPLAGFEILQAPAVPV